MMNDSQLIADCVNGNSRAWNTLVSKYGAVVYGTAVNVLSKYGFARRRDLADEIYQRVFVECWEKDRLGKLKDPSRLRYFLVSMSVSRSLDVLRTVIRHFKRDVGAAEYRMNSTDELERITSKHPDPIDAIHNKEILSHVESELNQLTFKERYILRLNSEQGLTHRQISELLQIPQDTVSTVIRRTREKLRNSLKQKGLWDL